MTSFCMLQVNVGHALLRGAYIIGLMLGLSALGLTKKVISPLLEFSMLFIKVRVKKIGSPIKK